MQHKKDENEQEFTKRIHEISELAAIVLELKNKSNTMRDLYPQKKRNNENVSKHISFRKVNKEESLST